MCRGLVIDTQRGNILKIDRHKYVRQAMHGFHALDADVRKAVYNKEVAPVCLLGGQPGIRCVSPAASCELQEYAQVLICVSN
jgi:hypothetical protein